jgi:hypothetical protein
LEFISFVTCQKIAERWNFCVDLFNSAVNMSDYIASNDRIIVNNELRRMWKEVVMAQLEILSRDRVTIDAIWIGYWIY